MPPPLLLRLKDLSDEGIAGMQRYNALLSLDGGGLRGLITGRCCI